MTCETYLKLTIHVTVVLFKYSWKPLSLVAFANVVENCHKMFEEIKHSISRDLSYCTFLPYDYCVVALWVIYLNYFHNIRTSIERLACFEPWVVYITYIFLRPIYFVAIPPPTLLGIQIGYCTFAVISTPNLIWKFFKQAKS